MQDDDPYCGLFDKDLAADMQSEIHISESEAAVEVNTQVMSCSFLFIQKN